MQICPFAVANCLGVQRFSCKILVKKRKSDLKDNSPIKLIKYIFNCMMIDSFRIDYYIVVMVLRFLRAGLPSVEWLVNEQWLSMSQPIEGRLKANLKRRKLSFRPQYQRFHQPRPVYYQVVDQLRIQGLLLPRSNWVNYVECERKKQAERVFFF